MSKVVSPDDDCRVRADTDRRHRVEHHVRRRLGWRVVRGLGDDESALQPVCGQDPGKADARLARRDAEQDVLAIDGVKHLGDALEQALRCRRISREVAIGDAIGLCDRFHRRLRMGSAQRRDRRGKGQADDGADLLGGRRAHAVAREGRAHGRDDQRLTVHQRAVAIEEDEAQRASPEEGRRTGAGCFDGVARGAAKVKPRRRLGVALPRAFPE